MTRIIQGVLDFQKRIFGEKKSLFQKLGQGQSPLALFITCSDSRIIPDLLAQTEPGELFILRNAGNIVPPHGAGSWAEAATIEYAVMQLRIRDIILCGHARCGAMHGLIEPAALAKLPSVSSWLEYARDILPKVQQPDLTLDQKLGRAIEQNVLLQLEHLRTHPSVAEGLAARTLRLHGWVYHFETGEVDAYDPVTGLFTPLRDKIRPRLLDNVDRTSGPRTEWEQRL